VNINKMTSIKDEGDKIVCGASLHVFVKGAYNLGPVIEVREATSANLSPGLGAIHATGAGGEDSYTEHGNDSPLSYCIIELDENQIVDCDATYAQYDNIPGLPYHMNKGAYFRNIDVADPPADVDPDTPLCPEATGTFGVAVEAGLVACSTTVTESYTAASVAGANGATAGNTVHSRICLRQAYFLTDPGAAYTTVAYEARGQ
jgi:hypothetical protein